jgi:hypothetical protein
MALPTAAFDDAKTARDKIYCGIIETLTGARSVS